MTVREWTVQPPGSRSCNILSLPYDPGLLLLSMYGPEDSLYREQGNAGDVRHSALWRWGVAGKQVSIGGGAGKINVVDTHYGTRCSTQKRQAAHPSPTWMGDV